MHYCYFEILAALTSLITTSSAPLHVFCLSSPPPLNSEPFSLAVSGDFWKQFAQDSQFWMLDGAVTCLVRTVPTKISRGKEDHFKAARLDGLGINSRLRGKGTGALALRQTFG